MGKEQLMVAALENGSVIDHIPTDKLFTIVKILGLDKTNEEVVIANNLESKMMGRKGLIKIAEKFFTEDEISKLAVVCENIRITVIRNYEVAEKREIKLPENLVNIVKCANPVCITNNEPMKTRFRVINPLTVKCHYCGKEQKIENIKLK